MRYILDTNYMLKVKTASKLNHAQDILCELTSFWLGEKRLSIKYCKIILIIHIVNNTHAEENKNNEIIPAFF